MPVLTKINSNVIADDAITGDMLGASAYLANTATQNISGTYSENRLYTSDAYTLSGNATINSHLTLSTIKSTGDVVLTAGGAYTITGTGTLSGGSMYGRNTVTGMSGEIESAVTGMPNLNLSNATFPSGKVTNVFRFYDDTSGQVTVNGTTTAKVASKPFSFSATSGRHYIVIGFQYGYSHRASGTLGVRTVGMSLWYGTTIRTMGANLTGDSFLNTAWLGSTLASDSSSGAASYWGYSYNGHFTASSTATHYVYTAAGLESSGGVEAVAHNATNNPHTCTIWEIMP